MSLAHKTKSPKLPLPIPKMNPKLPLIPPNTSVPFSPHNSPFLNNPQNDTYCPQHRKATRLITVMKSQKGHKTRHKVSNHDPSVSYYMALIMGAQDHRWNLVEERLLNQWSVRKIRRLIKRTELNNWCFCFMWSFSLSRAKRKDLEMMRGHVHIIVFETRNIEEGELWFEYNKVEEPFWNCILTKT